MTENEFFRILLILILFGLPFRGGVILLKSRLGKNWTLLQKIIYELSTAFVMGILIVGLALLLIYT